MNLRPAPLNLQPRAAVKPGPAAAVASRDARRVFENRRVWQLDQARFEAACDLLAAHVRQLEPTVIIGIANGGLRPALRLGELLELPCSAIAARHNASARIRLQATGRVELGALPAGLPDARARVLLVDDICGSGATLAAVTAALNAMSPAPGAISAVALCCNIGAEITPDAWVWDVADWTAFPWEPALAEPSEPLPHPSTVQVREDQPL